IGVEIACKLKLSFGVGKESLDAAVVTRERKTKFTFGTTAIRHEDLDRRGRLCIDHRRHEEQNKRDWKTRILHWRNCKAIIYLLEREMRTVNTTRYVTPLREGGSLPAIIEADDDGMYVLKFHGAGQGTKALIAELIAGELARAAGLLVPELVFVNLDPEIAKTEPDP